MNEEAIIEKRWEKKKAQVGQVANGLQRLRRNVYADMQSDDEKESLTALAVALMDKTAERVGNAESAANGHAGVTGFKKKHIKIDGNKITITYTGKSGVDQQKSFSDERVAKAMTKALANAKGEYALTTSDGFVIKADRVNRYLDQFDITAKDIRGYSSNRLVIDRLKASDAIEEEKKRLTNFNKIIRSVAKKIGHGAATLQKHYLVPELKEKYVATGEIIDIKELGYMEKGGEVESEKPSKKSSPPQKKEKKSAGFIDYYGDSGGIIFGGF